MKQPNILTLHPQVYLSQREELCETCGETVCVGCGALEEWVEEGVTLATGQNGGQK